MLSGFMDAAMTPATSILPGEQGTIAANISTMAPTQLIWVEGTMPAGICSKWKMRPRASAMSTRYPSPRSKMNLGSRLPVRA